MKQTGDQFLVKKINKTIVLETIRAGSPISRAKVSEATGLNKGTVSSLVSELIESQLVEEIGPGESSGGRKPLMLLFNQRAGHAIGVDIRVDTISAILTDLQGEIMERTLHPLTATEPEAVISVTLSAIRELIRKAPSSPYGIVGIGIGVPGIVDGQGQVLFAPNLNWSEVPLGQIISRALELPVVIHNEANSGAEGEKQFGAGRNIKNLIYLSVSHGIGTGIILNGEIYKGASGFSGEAGHFSIIADGKKCACGNCGCWELYASEKALIAEAHDLVQSADQVNSEENQPVLEWLVEKANSGDPEALEIFKRAGHYLGVGMANLINLFNPELIIIGNRLALAKQFIIQEAESTVQQRALAYHLNHVQIEFSKLNLDSTVLGAASFAITEFFDKTRVIVE